MTGADARDIMEAAIRRELFGPHPGEHALGKPLDLSAGPAVRVMASYSRAVARCGHRGRNSDRYGAAAPL